MLITRKVFLIAVVALIALCTIPSYAIHEDEQGLRDWIMRFAGDVHQAAIPQSSSPSLFYLASQQGAVSAVKVSAEGALNLTWRETFSAIPQCIATSDSGVVTVGANGAVFLLNAEQGFIETSFYLQIPEGSASAVACSANGNQVAIAMHIGATAHVFSFDITQDDEMIAVTKTFAVEHAVERMHVSPKHLWVSAAGSSTRYNIESGAKEHHVAGTCTGASLSGAGVLTTPTGLTIVKADGSTTSIECAKCGAGILVDARDGADEGGIVTVTVRGDKLVVAFPSQEEVVVPQMPSSGRHEILSAFSSDDGLFALVRAASRHLILVKSSGEVVWERREGIANAAATLVTDPIGKLDHFHFNKQVLLASKFGVLYGIPLADMGTTIKVLADFSVPLVAKLGAQSITDISIHHIARANTTTIVVRCAYKQNTAVVFIDLTDNAVKEVRLFEDAIVVAPKYVITNDLQLHGSLDHPELHVYVAKANESTIAGYSVSNATHLATPTWTARFPHPIIAHASGQHPERTAIVNNLRVYPNNTGKEMVEEVHHRYPTRNVVVVAYYEPSKDELTTLVITAIDAITGSFLATTKHRNVEGPVKIVVVEHTVIYYFMDAQKMRYCFGVWEMFEEESGPVVSKTAGATLPQIIATFFTKKDRVFSSRASRPPVVAVNTLGVYGGPLADMSVTTSQCAIARKSIVLAFETGRVAVVEVRHLLAGGQMPMPNSDKKLTHVIIPSVHMVSHKYRVALPQAVTTAPTNLESSSHVLVTGLDLFYVRSSSGKPFDLLNSDFNKPLLITLVAGFAVLSVVVRYLVMRKSLNAAWM